MKFKLMKIIFAAAALFLLCGCGLLLNNKLKMQNDELMPILNINQLISASVVPYAIGTSQSIS